MNIDFDFTERVYNIHFYGVMDILSRLGGLRASLLPIFGLLAPLFVTSFLYQLAKVSQTNVEERRLKEIVHFIRIARA